MRKALILFSLAVLAAACGGFEDKSATADTADTTQVEASATETAPAETAQTDTLPGDAGDTGGELVVLTGPGEWITDAQRTPINTHLTWQRDPSTTVTIQWTTLNTETDGYEPKVWFARADETTGAGEDMGIPYSDAYWTAGTGFNYTAVLTKDEAFVQWEVELTGLTADTDYVYRAGTWDAFDAGGATLTAATLSPIQRFRTGRTKGDRAPIRFIAAGDSRGGYDQIVENVDRLSAMDADFWVFSGDMNQMGNPDEWGSWFAAMDPISANTVLMPVQGNHEILGELYYEQFALPREEDGLPYEYVENAWHIVTGNILLIGLNSVTTSVVEEQKPWLKATLERYKDDADIDWRVVMYHHPAYSSSNHKSTGRVQDHWVPIFEDYGVDLSLSGHDHNYERSVPIRGSQEVDEAEGVIYVTAGAFFAPGYSNGNDWWTVVSHHGDKGNYAEITVEGKSLSLKAYSGDGNEILDEFTLTK